MSTEKGWEAGQDPIERRVSLQVGVIVRRRRIQHKWADYSWKAVGILPDAENVAAGETANWTELSPGEDWTDFYAGSLPLTLYRTDTEAYRVNLAAQTPSVYVVMRKVEPGDVETPSGLILAAVTASPYEGQDYLDNGEDVVEAVPMPPKLIAWMAEFTERHHVEEKFVKRQRRPAVSEREIFPSGPIFERKGRADSEGDMP